MKLSPLFPLALAALLPFIFSCPAGGGEPARPLLLKGGPHQISFGPENGSITGLRDGGARDSLLQSGESGLWQVRLQDGNVLNAAEFQAGPNPRHFESRSDGSTLVLSYQSPELAVTVRVTGQADGFEFQGQVTPAAQPVLEFVLPGRLRFDPARVERFVSPLHPHRGVGAAFHRSFFQPQPHLKPSGWRGENRGPAGYRHLFGEGLDMRDLTEAAVTIQVTDEGRNWLDAGLAGKLATPLVHVSRPSRRSQVDLVLLDSPSGPVLSASRLGGAGGLWRLGGQFEERDQPLAVSAASAVLRELASAPEARRKLALVSLLNGPHAGAGSNGSVAQWRESFQKLAGELSLELVELRSAEALVAAMSGADFLSILNPYGEWLPVPAKSDLPEVVEAVGAYVRAGGHWFEVGGYPFYFAMRPSRFLSYESTYPPVFSDFLHLDMTEGRVSLFRIQPRTWEPWSGAHDPQKILVPGRLAFAGDEQGGWCERAFSTFVPAGQTWTAPVVRLSLGRSVEDDLQTYCQLNEITRTLKQKLAPDLYDKLRRAVLLKYNGNVREKLAALDQLPVPTLIHYSDYLKGGFDKEYPDHLPPHPQFGSPKEFREFHDRARALGHLLMPYTNPTWWCDHPRGPSFEQAGDAPLLRNLDGSLAHEKYATNDGWTTCFWHPAVRAANRKTLREFTEDYPVDLLFQDQFGARGGRYDLNPASPTPFAYVEGLLSQADEDSRTIPLSTEDGWDGVLNAEAQLCGFTFALGAGQRVTWAREMKSDYHPSTWEIYPFLQRVAHDKAALLHHDLGKFVIDRPTLSWTLGLGFSLSYVVSAKALPEARHREWLRWLDRLQKSVCARYVGEPAGAFRHEQGGEEPGNDGVIRAEYGPVRLACNLSPALRQEAGKELAAYGFHASAPGLVAGNLQSLAGVRFGEEGVSFVSEGDENRAEIWIFARPGEEVAAELPAARSRELVLTLDGQPPAPASAVNGAVRFRLPPATGPEARTKRLWRAVALAK